MCTQGCSVTIINRTQHIFWSGNVFRCNLMIDLVLLNLEVAVVCDDKAFKTSDMRDKCIIVNVSGDGKHPYIPPSTVCRNIVNLQWHAGRGCLLEHSETPRKKWKIAGGPLWTRLRRSLQAEAGLRELLVGFSAISWTRSKASNLTENTCIRTSSRLQPVYFLAHWVSDVSSRSTFWQPCSLISLVTLLVGSLYNQSTCRQD